MKTMLEYLKKTSLFVLFIGLVIGCSKDENDDDVSPTFSGLQINGLASTDFIQVASGSTIDLTGTFNDDVALASYTIVSSSTKMTGTNALSINSTFTLSGLSQTIAEPFVVNANTLAGPYTLSVIVKDSNGSESGTAEFDIAVTNTSIAQINLTSPLQNAYYSSNDTIFLLGNVTDDTDLQLIEIYIEPQPMAGGLTAVGTVFYEEAFFLNGASETSWDFSEVNTTNNYVVIPTITTSGLYSITITVTDSDGNIAVIRRDVWIQP
tara:strand:+ start:184 stop:978 length:795 start_codon:yes stop_codon:yes gene_type:complete